MSVAVVNSGGANISSVLHALRRLGAEPEFTDDAATIRAADRVILPGQFARVRADYETLEDAVVVPKQALVEMQGLFRVYTVDGAGNVTAKEIEKGPETGNDVVVRSGIEAGETIIVEGLQRVRPGMTVLTKPWTPPAQG